jgi:CubicO group peptidase (beta-lactamase class C family)
MAELFGNCDRHFARVKDLLAEYIDSGKEVGASIYVSIDGQDVIDIWGGWHDKEHSAAWKEDTVVNVFSGSKTVTSLAVLMLVDRGLVELDAPVAKYWPEFAQNGKEKVTVRNMIGHGAGIPAWEPPFDLVDAMDIEGSTARLAAQAPWWEPGTRSSYHASTFGHLNAELIRRVTGKTLSQFVAEEIAGPLHADFYLGMKPDQAGRIATVYPAPEDEARTTTVPKAATDTEGEKTPEQIISIRTRLGSFSGVKRDPLVLFNSDEWRETEFGGSSGHANARGLGRIMTALCNEGVSRGVKLLSQPTIEQIFHEQFNGIDGYYMKPIRWGTGYALAAEDNKKGPLPFIRPGKSCFWYGTGGSLSIADVGRRVAISYVMNQCQSGRNSLNGVYYKAIYECLDNA